MAEDHALGKRGGVRQRISRVAKRGKLRPILVLDRSELVFAVDEKHAELTLLDHRHVAVQEQFKLPPVLAGRFDSFPVLRVHMHDLFVSFVVEVTSLLG